MSKQQKQQAKKDQSTKPAPVRTVNDILSEIQGEIEAIKSGDLNEARARIVAKNRQLQLDGISLVLQAARLEAKFRPALGERIGLPTAEEVITTTTQ